MTAEPAALELAVVFPAVLAQILVIVQAGIYWHARTLAQTITDLHSGARTRINDLDGYATGDLLDQDRTAVSLGVRQGIRSEPEGALLKLVSAEPESVKLKTDTPTVVLWACIDGTDVTDVLAVGPAGP